jgi:hypothetical protein
MRRRRRDGLEHVPVELLSFNEREWPGDTRAERFAAWRAALLGWARENTFPGGALAALRLNRSERLRVLGR